MLFPVMALCDWILLCAPPFWLLENPHIVCLFRLCLTADAVFLALTELSCMQAVFDSCRILDLRNATVSLGCVDLLRGAPSLERLRLRSDFFTADRGTPSKHQDLLKFIAQLPVRFLLPTAQQTAEPFSSVRAMRC